MLSYIKSEFYRLLRNKWTYLFIIICSGLLISENIVLAVVKASESTFQYATTEFSLDFFLSNLSMLFIICVSVASMVFGNEHSNHTMKNSISYGISRGNIYFGKLIIEVIYAIVAFVVITGLYIASAYLLLENSDAAYLEIFLKACFVAFPLFLFAIAVTNCFIFIIESTGAGIAAIIGLLIAFPLVCNILGKKFDIFRKFSSILPWSMINSIDYDPDTFKLLLPWEGAAGYYNYWIFGMIEMALIAVIGYLVFRKKEIK